MEGIANPELAYIFILTAEHLYQHVLQLLVLKHGTTCRDKVITLCYTCELASVFPDPLFLQRR